MDNEVKTLYLDIENMPKAGWAWSFYFRSGGNLIEIIQEDVILCHVSKWAGKKKLIVSRLDKKKGFKPPVQYMNGGILLNDNSEAEKQVAWDMWKLLDEADLVVGQNHRAFDLKKLNTRFELYGFGPPSPYQTYDTLMASRATFDLSSHSLDSRSKRFYGEEKLHHSGWRLWKGCMEGKRKDWNKMVKYNKQDVLLTEKDYLSLRKWGKHPNVAIYGELTRPTCPTCNSDNIRLRGFDGKGLSRSQKFVCNSCGAWSRTRVSELSTEQKKNLLKGV